MLSSTTATACLALGCEEWASPGNAAMASCSHEAASVSPVLTCTSSLNVLSVLPSNSVYSRGYSLHEAPTRHSKPTSTSCKPPEGSYAAAVTRREAMLPTAVVFMARTRCGSALGCVAVPALPSEEQLQAALFVLQQEQRPAGVVLRLAECVVGMAAMLAPSLACRPRQMGQRPGHQNCRQDRLAAPAAVLMLSS